MNIISPARGTGFAETLQSREQRIYEPALVCAGGRISAQTGFGSQNNPARLIIVIRHYPSAPCDPSLATRSGRRWLPPLGVGHPFAGLTHRQLWGAVQRFTPNALRLPTLPRGRRDMFLGLNLGAAIGRHCLFGAFRKFLQEPRSVLSVLSRPSPSVVFAHDEHNGRRKRQSAVKE